MHADVEEVKMFNVLETAEMVKYQDGNDFTIDISCLQLRFFHRHRWAIFCGSLFQRNILCQNHLLNRKFE